MKRLWIAPMLMSVSLAMAGPREDLDQAWLKGAKALAGMQGEDGGWGFRGAKGPSDVAATGLAVAGLAGNPDGRKEFADAIEKGCAYMLKNQGEKGEIHNAGQVPLMTNYKTAICVTALATADRAKYKDAIDKATKWMIAFQYQPGGAQPAEAADANFGGAGYDEKKNQPRADLSNTAYMLEALRNAEVPKDSETWKRAVAFLQRCQNRSESNDGPGFGGEIVVGDDGGFFYNPGGDGKKDFVTLPNGKKAVRSYGSMTYSGYKSMLYSGLEPDDPRVKSALGWIEKNYTLEENPGMGTKGMYYYYHAFATALDASGLEEIRDKDGEKHAWAAELAKKLGSLQQADGTWAGDKQWMEDMPPLPTLYSLMALNKARAHVK